jgi:hypothetical protein
MINGKGTWKKKIAIKAAPPASTSLRFSYARLPMRMTAAATIASTAGREP